MTLSRLQWYAARLSAMSPAEVLHRVREAGLKRAWKGNSRGWENFAEIGDRPLPALTFLRDRLAITAPTPVDLGKVEALGQHYDVRDPGAWFRDPVFGGTWPGAEAYCFGIDVRSVDFWTASLDVHRARIDEFCLLAEA